MKKISVKKDIILIAALFLIGAVIAAVVLLSGGKGAIVQVSVDGAVVSEYPLLSDLETDIHGTQGGVNHLVIKDGMAWMENADCPDGLCIKMGRIHQNGQSIICLPHKIVVQIVAESKTDSSEQPDVIVR